MDPNVLFSLLTQCYYPQTLTEFLSGFFLLFMSVSVYFCPFRSVSVRFCPFLSVSFRFLQFPFVSFRFSPFLSVSVHFCPFLPVSVRLFLSVSLLSVCFSLFMSVSLCFWIFWYRCYFTHTLRDSVSYRGADLASLGAAAQKCTNIAAYRFNPPRAWLSEKFFSNGLGYFCMFDVGLHVSTLIY